MSAGKYSLEAYRRYPEARVCPPLSAAKPAQLAIAEVSWRKAEAKRGEYAFDIPKVQSGHTLLNVNLEAPDWAREGQAGLAASFVRRLGKETNGGAAFSGVLLNRTPLWAEDTCKELARAFADAFDNSFLIVSPKDGLAEILKAEDIPFGLVLNLSGGILPLRTQLAQGGLQRVWQKCPVFVKGAAPEGAQEAEKVVRGWHAAAAEGKETDGCRVALRRLTFPAQVSAGGALPLRLWWQNMGTSPLYGKSTVRLRLSGGGITKEIAVHDEKETRIPGDAVHNEIIQLPQMPAGEYTLQCAVFCEHKGFLPLANDVPGENGWYTMATITLDDVKRPEAYEAWNGYYPEGYYPLEDPKLPV